MVYHFHDRPFLNAEHRLTGQSADEPPPEHDFLTHASPTQTQEQSQALVRLTLQISDQSTPDPPNHACPEVISPQEDPEPGMVLSVTMGLGSQDVEPPPTILSTASRGTPDSVHTELQKSAHTPSDVTGFLDDTSIGSTGMICYPSFPFAPVKFLPPSRFDGCDRGMLVLDFLLLWKYIYYNYPLSSFKPQRFILL